MAGWIKIHRKFTKWEWYDEPNTVRLFIHLLLSANYEQKEWHGMTIYPGQLVTGRKKLSIELGISEQEIRTSITRLKSTSELAVESTNQFSIITICKWADYQESNDAEQPANQPAAQPTSNQPSTTTKEYKELKKKEYIGKIQKKFYQSLIEFVNDFDKETIRKFYDYWSEPNKSKTQIRWQLEKTWDTKRRLQRWEKNNFNAKNRTNNKGGFESDKTRATIAGIENGFT